MEKIFAHVINERVVCILGVSFIFAILLPAFECFRRLPYIALLSLAAAGVVYRQRFSGFLCVNLVAYVLVLWIGKLSDTSYRWRRGCATLAALGVVFTAGRVFGWENAAIPTPIYVFDMWNALRLMTLLWEVGSGVPAPSLVRFITWTCLPLTLLGPILRYSRFPEAVHATWNFWFSSKWWLTLVIGLTKLATGTMLGVVQAVITTTEPASTLWTKAAVALITGPIGFYLTYAGFYQIVEALGRPCGYALPESYNFPIARQNIADFWANWNMTATSVFRDYLFYNRWGFKSYNMYVNSVIVFVIVGLWHDANVYWLLWGACHGVLFCTFLAWRKYLKPAVHLPLQGTAYARGVATALTYISVCACWYIPTKIVKQLSL